MPKFFIEKLVEQDQKHIHIKGDDKKHIEYVLRMKPGDIIDVCDLSGTNYSCEIKSFNKEYVELFINERLTENTESPLSITVYQGIPKFDKMELIIQKAVELGASKIVPVICNRSIAKFKDKKDIEKKIARWNKISHEASKQSNRSIIPKVCEPLNFKESIEYLGNDSLNFLLWESENKLTIKDIIKNEKSDINLFVGPEGGFALEEIEYAKHKKMPMVTIGKRILRTETAALAVLSMILYEKEL